MAKRSLLALVCWVGMGAWSCGGGSGGYEDVGDHSAGQVDPVIGAACQDDRDCLDRCAQGERFPGGFCTLTCNSDAECTGDTVCIEDQGGVCAFPCSADQYCRDLLDTTYECKDRDGFGGGEREVCVGDP